MGYDLLNAFSEISIFEDIYRSRITGYIDVMESEFVRETMPIIGEEYLSVEFASTTMTNYIPDDYIKFNKLLITKMTRLEESHKATEEDGMSQEQYTYRLHFESLSDKLNRVKRVRKAFRGTSTEIATTILKQMMNKDLETVDPAKHTIDVVFPNWQPFRCIHYLNSISVSAKYNDPYYLFYEDRDGYHLTTMSALFDKGKKHDIKKVIVQSLVDPVQDDYILTGMTFNPLFDTWDNEIKGMYGCTLTTYDKINKRWKEESDTYSASYGKFKHVGKKKLTQKNASEMPKQRQQFMMTSEPKSPGGYEHTDEYAIYGPMREAQCEGLRTSFTLNRATSIKLGDIVNIDHKNKSGDPDKVIGGDWLITRMRHIITPVAYMCMCDAIKDGLG